jgi:pimeloyl-ACP methyl ester carboxylesterase
MRLSDHRIGPFLVTEHAWNIPIDHDEPGETISVFAREVVQARSSGEPVSPKGRAHVEASDRALALPWLVFLQGGPGFEATRPMGSFGWVARAAESYRVLLLDQRGTGCSTAVNAESLAARGDAATQAEYLRKFRADAIVRDCEFIRRDLGIEQWSVLGQSFGGFCLLHYLSAFPESLRQGFFTGGIPPIGRTPDEIYQATYRRMVDRNAKYYERYPQDVDRVRSILQQLEDQQVYLPSGDRLTARRYRTLGHSLGMSTGAEEVHYLVERGLQYWALRGIENAQKWDTNPMYQVLHESSYANGHATRWSAQRVRPQFPQFDALDLPFFTGEHVYPWQLEDWQRLQPLADVAEILAEEVWPVLYDPVRLASNSVPCAAAVYTEDLYVERQFSEEVAKHVPGIKLWLTDEHDHDALRVVGGPILDRLFTMLES